MKTLCVLVVCLGLAQGTLLRKTQEVCTALSHDPYETSTKDETKHVKCCDGLAECKGFWFDRNIESFTCVDEQNIKHCNQSERIPCEDFQGLIIWQTTESPASYGLKRFPCCDRPGMVLTLDANCRNETSPI